MNTIRTVFAYQIRDLLRSKWIIGYALFWGVATEALLRYSGADAKALMSLATVMLFVVPLVTVVYGTIYLYNTREFTEVLLAQPVRRGQLYAGLYLGVTVALSAAVVLGIALPSIACGVITRPLAVMVIAAAALTCVFSALAFLIAVCVEDRLRGLGVAIVVWLAFGLVYDGALLVTVASFADYQLERFVLVATLFNPMDLARVLLLMQFDSAALMGYTGAVFERFFAGTGAVVAAIALLAWITVPAVLAGRAFRHKDF